MKILLIEDDFIYAETLKVILVKNLSIDFYDITCVDNYEDFMEVKQTTKFDLIICDLILSTEKSGIDVLEVANQNKIPIILITSSSDLIFYEKAKSIKAINYLIKPIHPITLISIIEKIFAEQQSNYLILKDNSNKYIQVPFDEIHWIESDRNYSTIVTKKRKNSIKVSLSQLITKLDYRFQRCHHSFIVNVNFISSIDTDGALINNTFIPIGRSYRKKVLDTLKWSFAS